MAGTNASEQGKIQRWQIGDVRITKVTEIEMPGPASWIVPDATPENLARETWLQPHFADAQGMAVMSVHALVVESCGQKIVVDTCVGNDKDLNLPNWKQRTGPFLEDLREAGHDPDSVDTVLCTHLHVDHVGWNTRWQDGRWLPTFGNARYLFEKSEIEHWEKFDQKDFGEVMAESVAPVVEAGLVDRVGSDHVVTDEVRLQPTPGHTPGHVSVCISSQGERAVITGDLMHHPVQCAHPDWGSSADWQGEMAAETRRGFLEQHADTPTLIIGTHFATPTAGRIVRDGSVYRFAV